MISYPIARYAVPFRTGRAIPLVGTVAVVTALADWLFYWHPPGISVAIFLAALCAAVLLTNPIRASRTELVVAIAVLAAALLPAIEDFGLLSSGFAVVGASAFALLATGWTARSAVQRLTDIAWMIVPGPFRLFTDLGCALQEAGQRGITKQGAVWLMAWIVPIGLGGVFLLLFSQANPLIAQWLTSADTPHWKNLDLVRPLFWLAVIVLIWPFLQVRIGRKPTMQDILNALEPQLVPAQSPASQPPPLRAASAAAEPADGPLFGRTAIVRSLVVFNALFFVQSALDVTYLWGGVALPAGMSYASYAHRGAYPLILTALLAAAFVLAAMRPGKSVERSRLVRALVFVWIGQNVLLVLSSMLRLDLYVEVYSLTEWRCAAFVWMLLIAAGLVLIVARIVLDRSNRWLVWGNVSVLVLTLYICSLVDFSGLIARFNVMHSWDITGTGQQVDMAYLCSLGPAALPALDLLTAKANASGKETPGLDDCIDNLEQRHAAHVDDWRAWTFRSYRLQRFLDERDARALAKGA
jgi:Domain of unknown function (DUF4153)